MGRVAAGLGAVLIGAQAMPASGWAQASKSVSDVHAICNQVDQAMTRSSFLGPERAAALKRTGPACCQAMARSAADLSAPQRGYLWQKLEVTLMGLHHQYLKRREAEVRLNKFYGTLLLKQRSAANNLLVRQSGCNRLAREGRR